MSEEFSPEVEEGVKLYRQYKGTKSQKARKLIVEEVAKLAIQHRVNNPRPILPEDKKA